MADALTPRLRYDAGVDVLAEQMRSADEAAAWDDWRRALIEGLAAELRGDDDARAEATGRMLAAAQEVDRLRGRACRATVPVGHTTTAAGSPVDSLSCPAGGRRAAP